MLATASPIIGRDVEHHRIRATIEALGAGGGPAGVLVTGSAGIGKSVLLASSLDGARAAGWPVLAVQADALEREIAYAALARMFGPAASDAAHPDVATAARELIATVEAVGAGRRQDARASFGLICGQVTKVLQTLLEHAPAIVALDDLDALDEDTLGLLAVVVGRLAHQPLALMATARTTPPGGSQAFSELVRRLEHVPHGLLSIELPGLPPSDLSGVLARLVGGEPDRALVAHVHARAAGVPFFAEQIAEALVRSGFVAVSGRRARLTVPPAEINLTGLGALLRRVLPLDAQARCVLDAIAVAGASQIGWLPDLTGLTEDAIDEAIDELAARGLLTGGGAGTCAFVHDLVRDAVYDGIGPARRRRLHRLMASFMQDARTRGSPVDVLALARHVSLSAEPGDGAAQDILVEAADATRSAAPRAAAGLYERALALLAGTDERRPALLGRRARALALCARPADAIAVGRDALADLPAGLERRSTASAVVNSLIEVGRLEEALSVIDGELAAGAAAPPVVADRARALWHLERFDEALQEACRAEAMPASSAVERLLTLAPLNIMSACAGRPLPLPDLPDEMLRLAAELSPRFELLATATASYALATSGYPGRALAPLQRAEALAERLGGLAFRDSILVARAFVDWQQARWEEATDGICDALHELTDADFGVQVAALRGIEIEITWRRGEPVADEQTDRPAPAPNVADLKAWAVAGARAAAGDVLPARTAIARALDHGPIGVCYRSPLLARSVDIELAAGDRAAAGAALEALEANAKELANPWTDILVARCRAALYGDVDAAREAVDRAAAAGNTFEQILAELQLAELDEREGELLAEVYRALHALGADPLCRAAGGLLRARGLSVPRPARASSGVLTDAELKVARLVREGMRNREIAAALHYSPKTVEHYISHIFTKLNVSSRVEIATALNELLTPGS